MVETLSYVNYTLVFLSYRNERMEVKTTKVYYTHIWKCQRSFEGEKFPDPQMAYTLTSVLLISQSSLPSASSPRPTTHFLCLDHRIYSCLDALLSLECWDTPGLGWLLFHSKCNSEPFLCIQTPAQHPSPAFCSSLVWLITFSFIHGYLSPS